MSRTFLTIAYRIVAVTTLIAFTACASSTTIQSTPSGARLYLNGEPVGTTPYTMTDTKVVGSTTTVRLEIPGYETTTGAISRNEEFSVGACIAGVFVLVPFLWIMGYKPTHTYELRPVGATAQGAAWQAPPPVYPGAPGVQTPPTMPPMQAAPPLGYPAAGSPSPAAPVK